MKNKYSNNKDWTMVVWVGGDPQNPIHLRAQTQTQAYLEQVFNRHGKDHPLLRKAAGLLSDPETDAKSWEGVSRDASLDFIDEKGVLYAAQVLRVSRTMLPDSISSMTLHAISAGKHLEDVARKYRVKLICADAPRFAGRLHAPMKTTGQSWSMSMVANDPMRNHALPRQWDVMDYQQILSRAVSEQSPDASPIETIRQLLPEIAKQNSAYTFGEFDNIGPASGADMGPSTRAADTARKAPKP